MEMVVLLSRDSARLPSRNVKRKRKKDRRLLFGRKKHYQKPFFFETGPFKGWPSQATGFLGFGEDEIGISKACSNWASQQLDFTVRKVTSICIHNHEPYTFVVKPIPIVRSARVLSLCDGIATGLYILQNLNIPVDYYFSCEVDEDCRTVQRSRWPNELINLGDVQTLAANEELLTALLPVHIIFASPPCKDLTMLNAHRKEWQPGSTAFRTLDCIKIIRFVERKMGASSLPFFWLLEQTSHMQKECLARLQREVKEPLYKICSSSHCATFRKRYYCGNIPELQSNALKVSGKYSGDSLQRYLDPYRYARKLVASCITSNKSLQDQPVEDVHGVRYHLTIQEQEKLMGFSGSYTAVGDLSLKVRQGLVGRAWNIHTLTAILRPITEFFGSK